MFSSGSRLMGGEWKFDSTGRAGVVLSARCVFVSTSVESTCPHPRPLRGSRSRCQRLHGDCLRREAARGFLSPTTSSTSGFDTRDHLSSKTTLVPRVRSAGYSPALVDATCSRVLITPRSGSCIVWGRRCSKTPIGTMTKAFF